MSDATRSTPPTIAKILHHGSGAITFAVDDVEPATELFEVEPLRDFLDHRLERKCEILSHQARVVRPVCKASALQPDVLHPLVDAIYRSFATHRPLVLKPDDIALVIIQGFAHHVQNHAEELRGRLVAHQGQNKIVVETDRWSTVEDWELIVEQLCARVREQTPPALGESLRCDFTTTTPAMRVAGEIGVLGAFDRYFEYIVACICGIPRITLTGTVEDWCKLRLRIDALGQYELEWWIQRLAPILDEFVATAEGRPSLDFWQAICKPQQAYGTEVITGWVTDLFPYLRADAVSNRPTRRNPSLEWQRVRWAPVGLTVDRFHSTGVAPKLFPNGLSEVSFKILMLDQFPVTRMLVAGFLGLQQTDDGALGAEIGWAIAPPEPQQEVLDLIRQPEHLAEPVSDRQPPSQPCPSFWAALTAEFDRVVLFAESDLAWEMSSLIEATVYRHRRERATLFARRKDGATLAWTYQIREREWEWAIWLGHFVPQETTEVLSISQGIFYPRYRLTATIEQVVLGLLQNQGEIPLDARA